MSTKLVVTHRQDSIRPCRAHAVLSMRYNYYLLDVYRQLACMKLGSRGKYQPMQYCWVHTSRLLGYLVHTCHLPMDIQQIYCSTQTGQHERCKRECCPVVAMAMYPFRCALCKRCVIFVNNVHNSLVGSLLFG